MLRSLACARASASPSRGEELRGLSEPHVVGEAGPETEITEEAEPPEPPLLVGAQLTDETLGGGPGSQPRSSAPARRSPSHPSASTVVDGQVARWSARCPRAVRTTSPADIRSRAAVLVADRGDGGGDVAFAQLHPLAAEPHERLFQARQLPQLGEADLVVAENRLPLDLAQRVEPDGSRSRPALADRVRALSRRPRRALSRSATTGRQHAESRLFEDGRTVAEEVESACGVGHLFDGHRGGQGGTDRRHEPAARPSPRSRCSSGCAT